MYTNTTHKVVGGATVRATKTLPATLFPHSIHITHKDVSGATVRVTKTLPATPFPPSIHITHKDVHGAILGATKKYVWLPMMKAELVHSSLMSTIKHMTWKEKSKSHKIG